MLYSKTLCAFDLFQCMLSYELKDLFMYSKHFYDGDQEQEIMPSLFCTADIRY